MFIIRSSAQGNLDCFHFLDTVNKALVNTADQVSVAYDAEALGHILGSGITEIRDRFIWGL